MALDRQRIAGEDGLTWTPQFRDIESLWRMIERVGERAALAFFASNLHEQVQAGKIQDAEAAAACRMLDQAGYGAPQGVGHQPAAEPARLPAGGHLMSPAQDSPVVRRCSCSSCTAPPRSAAGSTPSTRTSPTTGPAILQRLYPVWALIGPGLSDPGHIEIHSRTVYLDSDALLGTREQIAAGRLERRAILRCFGVALHETFHAKHTKRWAIEHDIALSESDDPVDRQLAVDRRLLEEPRMEAHGVREHPADTLRGRFVRRALQAAVIDVILPAFAEQLLAAAIAGTAARRATSPPARPCTCRRAPTTASSTRPSSTRCGIVWRQVLGDRDLDRLDELYAKLVWIPDGELERARPRRREYRAIIGPPDPPEHPEGRDEARAGERLAAPAGSGDDGQPAAGSLADALEQAIERAHATDSSSSSTPTSTCSRCSQTRQPTQGEARQSAGARDRAADRADARPRRRPTRRAPTRSSTPAATPPGCARRSRTAPGRSTSAPPAGGSTAAPTPAAKRNAQTGRPVSTHPWRITRQVTAPIQEPHVGLVIDTSGSMGAYEYALGPICWILTDGLRQIGGRCATALFGNSAALLADGTPAAAARPRDPDRRRHRVRRRRDRARLRPARDDQPAPPPLRLRALTTAAGPTPGPASSGSAGSPSTTSRRSTSRSGSRRCPSSATAST